jgi:hypothetical protein
MQNAESPIPPFAKGGLGGIKLYGEASEKFFENDMNSEDHK